MSAASQPPSCPDDNRLLALTQGTLSGGEVAALEAHFDTCDACMMLVAELARAFEPVPGDVLDDAAHTPQLSSSSDDGEYTPEVSQTLDGTSVAGATHDFPEDEALTIGRYAVVEQVGEGGMGVVYRAVDMRLGRHVALKLLRPDMLDPRRRDASAARMQREARLLAALSHPNVLTIHDVGQWRGQVYIAAEFIEGDTLSTWLQRAPRDWREIVERFAQAGRGLVAAHAAGQVHRDIKPENIMVGADGRVRVTDFGLARGSESSPRMTAVTPNTPADAGMTRTGDVFGTPAYMSPEQHQGERAGPASDQFSFCVSLFEALHGARPFPGDSREALAEAVCAGQQTTPTTNLDVPASLRAALQRGLAASPLDRHPSMAALVEVLEACLQPPSPDTIPHPALTARRAVISFVVVALAVGLTLAAVDFSKTSRSPASEATPMPPPSAVVAVAADIAADTSPPSRCPQEQVFSLSRDACVEARPCKDAVAFRTERGCIAAPSTHDALARACRADDLLACVELSDVLGDIEAASDDDRALEIGLLQRACDGGSAKGCYELAARLKEGEVIAQDFEVARRLLEIACDGGNLLGCNDLGLLFTKGQGVEVDLPRARALLTAACDNGLATACYNIAGFYASGRGMPQDMERARSLYHDACLWGYGAACRWSATFLTKGDYIEPDLPEAASYWATGCDKGDALSCHQLGGVSYHGRGTPKDLARARFAYERACELEHGLSCWNAGHMFLMGQGGPEDRARCVTLVHRGCAHGDPKPCYFSGLYRLEEGRPDLARDSFFLACDGGRIDACFSLGKLARDGLGGPVNLDDAEAHFRTACEHDIEGACEALDALLASGRPPALDDASSNR